MPGNQNDGTGLEGEKCNREQAAQALDKEPVLENKRETSFSTKKDLELEKQSTASKVVSTQHATLQTKGQRADESTAALNKVDSSHEHSPGHSLGLAHGQADGKGAKSGRFGNDKRRQGGASRDNSSSTSSDSRGAASNRGKGRLPVYGALDLGTNNCRLLLARPNRRGFQIVDAFSRIIRLGEGVSEAGRLSDKAIDRTIAALEICAEKMAHFHVSRSRLVATEACRAALNSQYFVDRVKRKTGLDLEIIDQETEAKLAVSGCVTLVKETCDYALIFDIGGGSSELIWLDIKKLKSGSQSGSENGNEGGNVCGSIQEAIVDWVSIPLGVVTLAEKFGGKDVSAHNYQDMVGYVEDMLQDFARSIATKIDFPNANIHYLGTSGTVTTIAGIHLNLDVYDRSLIDGLWMDMNEVQNITDRLLKLDFEGRARIPSIGRERADLVLGGCAILQAMLETWPTDELRVADRGLREGILAELMVSDGFIKPGQCWVSSPKRTRNRSHRHHRGHSRGKSKGTRRHQAKR